MAAGLVLGLGLSVGAGGGTGVIGVPDARADEAPAQPADVTSPGCLIKGNYPAPKGAQLFDAPSGGNVLGTLTGAWLPMTLSAIPFDPTSGRARLSTSMGTGAMRIDGYVPATAVPLYTARDIPAYGASIWISSAQKVRLVKATANELTVEISVNGTMNQTVRATAPCDAFALAKGHAQPTEIAGNARGWLMKKSSIDLYDRANGDVVFTLNMMEGTGQLFWSTEMKGAYVHVTTRGDLTIDAWAKITDLSPLKKGEMMDQLIPPTTQVAGAQLALDKPPPMVRATRDIPIRAKRDEKAKPIGVIESGADIYVMETVAGWTNILPKSLGITPPEDGGFWIPATEVPK
jgi:hypothetical protein